MTKAEAIELENRCDKIMSGYLGMPCTVSMALSGSLKIELNDGDYITWKMSSNRVDYINYVGFYSDLEDDINNIQGCISENYDIFKDLMWSYEHRGELEDSNDEGTSD